MDSKFVNYEIPDDISSKILSGESYSQIVRQLKNDNRFNHLNKDEIKTLVYTAGTRLFNEERAKSIEKVFKYYTPCAICDDNTCEKCRQMHGKVFLLKDRQKGVNFPPFHDGCRCSFTIEELKPSEWIDDNVATHGEDPKPKLSFWERRKIKKLLKKG